MSDLTIIFQTSLYSDFSWHRLPNVVNRFSNRWQSLAAATASSPRWSSADSFQKVQRPEVPQIKDESFVANEVDNFVLARLESAGLTPAPSSQPFVQPQASSDLLDQVWGGGSAGGTGLQGVLNDAAAQGVQTPGDGPTSVAPSRAESMGMIGRQEKFGRQGTRRPTHKQSNRTRHACHAGCFSFPRS